MAPFGWYDFNINFKRPPYLFLYVYVPSQRMLERHAHTTSILYSPPLFVFEVFGHLIHKCWIIGGEIDPDT